MSSRLFRLHILNSGHMERSVHTKAYGKIKDFVHGEPLHRSLQKYNNFRNFMIFYVFIQNFMILFGLEGVHPGVRKLLFLSMLRRKYYSKRGRNLECVIRKASEKPWFGKWHFTQCFHSNRYELVLTDYQKHMQWFRSKIPLWPVGGFWWWVYQTKVFELLHKGMRKQSTAHRSPCRKREADLAQYPNRYELVLTDY